MRIHVLTEPVENDPGPGESGGGDESFTVYVVLRGNRDARTVVGWDGDCRVADLDDGRQSADEAVWQDRRVRFVDVAVAVHGVGAIRVGSIDHFGTGFERLTVGRWEPGCQHSRIKHKGDMLFDEDVLALQRTHQRPNQYSVRGKMRRTSRSMRARKSWSSSKPF